MIRVSKIQPRKKKVLVTGVSCILLVLKGFSRAKRHCHHVLLIADCLSHRSWLGVCQSLCILLLEKVLVLTLVIAVPHHERVRYPKIHLVALQFHSTE